MSPEQSDYCGHAGHEWIDAGGGMQICAVCEAMRETPIPDVYREPLPRWVRHFDRGSRS